MLSDMADVSGEAKFSKMVTSLMVTWYCGAIVIAINVTLFINLISFLLGFIAVTSC